MIKFNRRVIVVNKIFAKLFKTTKILLLFLGILVIQKVNIINNHDKLTNENLNKTLDLTAMAVKLEEIQYADKFYPLDTFTGDLTGYGAHCPLCSGYLGCTGEYVGDGTTTYDDADYGNVRIVASSKNLPCGSIITFDAKYLSNDPVVAIVLDRGVLGNDIDLLVESENYALKNVGRHKLTYDVLRFGWKR